MSLDSFFKITKSFQSFSSKSSPKRNDDSNSTLKNCGENKVKGSDENLELTDEDFILQLLAAPNSNQISVDDGIQGQGNEASEGSKKRQSDEDFILELLSSQSSSEKATVTAQTDLGALSRQNSSKSIVSTNSLEVFLPSIKKNENLEKQASNERFFNELFSETTPGNPSSQLYNTLPEETETDKYSSNSSFYQKFHSEEDEINLESQSLIITSPNNEQENELSNELLSQLFPEDNSFAVTTANNKPITQTNEEFFQELFSSQTVELSQDFENCEQSPIQQQLLDSVLLKESQYHESIIVGSQEKSIRNFTETNSSRFVMRDLLNFPTNKINDVKIFNEDYMLKTIASQTNYTNNQSNNKENCLETNFNPLKPYIKCYKKGKTKIFKLKNSTTKRRASQETVITSKSSYITDDSKSENLSIISGNLTQTEHKLRDSINSMSKDKSLLFNPAKNGVPIEPNKEEIIMKIEEIFLEILEAFNNGGEPVLKVRRNVYDNCVFEDNRLQMKSIKDAKISKIVYNRPRSRPKFCLMLHIMSKVKNLLENNTKLTKREIYYQIKHLIKNQMISDAAISAVSYLLDVGQWSLNIIGGSGLVYGNLKLVMASGEAVNCKIPGTRIPHDLSNISEIQSVAKFILVIEKEAMFYQLLEDLPKKMPSPFIMITGKGFPDINTRFFLNKLWMILAIPVFILVDADVYGIRIMITYKFGSLNNSHVSRYLAVPEAIWLGVFPSEITKLDITNLPLTDKDKVTINNLLKSPYVDNNARLVEELKIMLNKNYKAEIEGLMRNSTFLSDSYLLSKFYSYNCI